MTKQSRVRPGVRARSAWPGRMTAATLVAGCAVGMSACSSGYGTSGSTHSAAPRTTGPTANAATCKHVNSLHASLEDITHVQLNASAEKQIRTDVSNIKTQLAALKGSASGNMSTQINQLSAAADKVTKAGGNFTKNPSAAQVQAVVSALGGLKTTAKSTVADLQARCPQS